MSMYHALAGTSGEWIKSLPAADYHARSELSASDIRMLLRSPAEYRYAKDNPESRKATPSQELGTLCHSVFLEKAQVLVAPSVSKVSKAGKEEYQAFIDANRELIDSGKAVVADSDDAAVIEALRRSLISNVKACELLTACNEREITGIAPGSTNLAIPATGMRIRCDALGKDTILDLKTTSDASPEAFKRSVYNYGYDVQAAHYLAVAQDIDWSVRSYAWLVMETKAPYNVVVYYPSHALLERGALLRSQAIATYYQCLKANNWPGYIAQEIG